MPESRALRGPQLAVPAAEAPRGRILLVEAHAIVALDLQRVLREAGWRTVGPATSPADVRALMARGRLDGAVVDLDGLGQTATEIADLLAESGLPFVFMTAGRDRVPARHKDRPVVDKPYAASELLSSLERAIGKVEQAIEEEGIVYPITIGPISWPRVLPQL